MDKQGLPNGHVRPGNSNGFRIPTVDEALPYTPFSSIIPFSPDVIPTPSALPTTTPTAFGTSQDVLHAKRVLEQLSAGATSAEAASKRCQQTIRDVQKLLDPANLTEFKFKRPAKQLPINHTSTSGDRNLTPDISPFANIMLDEAKFSFRYLTPTSPEPPTKPELNGKHAAPQSGQATVQRPSTTETPQNVHSTRHSSHPPTASQGSVLQAVVVPKSMTPAQLAEFQVMSDPDSLPGANDTTPSKRHENNIANGYRAASVDQRQKGDFAVQNLQSLLQEIFEAEDQMQPDTSGVAIHENAFFMLRTTDDGAVPVLQPAVQSRLESMFQKVVNNGRLESIEIECLVHVQRICEVAVAVLESSSFSIDDDFSEQDGEEWVERVATAEKGLIGARTLMRIMSAGSHIKELQSEDLLRAIIAAFRNVIDTLLVPLAEVRPSLHEKIRGVKEEPPSNPKWVTPQTHQHQMQSILHAATKSFRVLGEFLTKTDVDETSLSAVEMLCKLLIFAENADNDRETVLGIQNFETSRRCAMDVLAKIFTKYSDQRQIIFDDILTSLEKLPSRKQSARQFRLLDAKPIQLVSALLMRLVQTSATFGGEARLARSKPARDGQAVEDSEESEGEEDQRSDEEENVKVSTVKVSNKNQPNDLIAIAKPLHDVAQTNASFIVKMLLQKAMKTAKSSDEPYRKLLDIFTEDFLSVLGSSDWPAAEMLLRTLVIHMITHVESPKSQVPSRTLALELLGTIGSGILELQISARKTAQTVETSDDEVAQRLCELVQQLETGEIDASSVVSFNGPYRMVLEYLQARGLDDAQLLSARGYHLMQWAFYVCGGREGSADSDDSDGPRSSKDLQAKLRSMILDVHWLEEHHDYPPISTSQGRLAAMVLALSSRLCKAFNKIFSVLLTAMSSEHANVKSRSLKSIEMLLAKDPSIFDRNAQILNHIFRATIDGSPLVRTSALKLIEDCLKLRPTLSTGIYTRVIPRTRDATVGVRKKAMQILKDIYLRHDDMKLRAAIADAIIARMEDTEESVTKLARQHMEEIWFVPFHRLTLDGEHAVEAKLRYGAQAALLIRTIDFSDDAVITLLSLIKDLTTPPKAASTAATTTTSLHFGVCQSLVHILCDGIIDNSEIPSSPSQPTILRLLAMFAKAAPKLFSASQIELLEPYTQSLVKTDDLEVYSSAVTILRHVMPRHPNLRPDFLLKLQTSLLSSVSKLPKAELKEVVPCVLATAEMLKNTDRVTKFATSALQNLASLRTADLIGNQQAANKASKLMTIVGQFGYACDFDKDIAAFKAVLPKYKGESVAGLLVEILCPFASSTQPLSVRAVALDAICTVAQGWPKQFSRPDVVCAFDIVFKEREPTLEEVLLSGLEGFYGDAEAGKSVEHAPELGTGVASGTERLTRTYVATDTDGAGISMAQRFLSEILRLALSSVDELAFTAARIIVSISTQGLVHPKESSHALVALETCPSTAIANKAFTQHKALASKHESLFDKEHMRAVQMAYEYQRDTIGDTAGYTGQPPVSKLSLLWEVLKAGKAQVRKKFLGNLVQKLDFNLSTLATSGTIPSHLAYVRFCLENLAFFEYDKVEELLLLLSALEKSFSTTGTTVAQAIESEVLHLRVDMPSSDAMVNGVLGTTASDPAVTAIDPSRLRQLATSAQICTMIYETRTFLRRIWNMQKHMVKTKKAGSETNKAPSRATNAANLTDAYVKRVGEILSAGADDAGQQKICGSFVELINVDTEVKVGSDEEEGDVEMEIGYDTPSEGTSRKSPSVPPSGDGRGKKRKSIGENATPKKRKRPSAGRKRSGSLKMVNEDDEEGGWD